MLRAALLALLIALAPAAGADVASRVVSMNPSLTAILLALGARDALVGVDDYSRKSQPGLDGVPAVGGLANPGLESVVALEPDLVVVVPSVEQRGFRTRLREMGIRVLELNPYAFEEVLETILGLGEAVGRRGAAEARVAAIRRARREVEEAVRDLPRPTVVLVLQREPLFVVGRGSFIDSMLGAAGALNLGAALDERYPRVALEWLVARAPEVLLDASEDAAPAARYWARLPSLPAVREGRVAALDRGTATLPGPWLDEALWILARVVHGPALGRGAAP
jgi:ABC-type Fe3+-hydroxamate transport system substrate-binding protein